VNDTHTGILKERKETTRQVQTAIRTVHALVDNLSIGCLAVVGYGDFFVTVPAVVPFRDIERDDKVAVGVGSTAGSQSRVVEGEFLGASVGITCAFVVRAEGDMVGGKHRKEE